MNEKYKATLRIPTPQQYAYIEVGVEDTPEGIIEAYRRLTELTKEGPGIDDKAMDTFIERYICEQPNHVETYQAMSPEQQKMVQIIKRAKARIKAKTNKQ